jgi:hypothetical protein
MELTMSQENLVSNDNQQVATEEQAQLDAENNTAPTGQQPEETAQATSETQQPNNKQEQSSPKPNFDEEIEKSKAFRVRIDRLNRQHRRELQQILQQSEMRTAQLIAQIVQPMQQQAAGYGSYGAPVQPTAYPGIDMPPPHVPNAEMLNKQQEEQKRQAEDQQDQYNFQQQVDKVMDEYEDFNDVANQIQLHITPSMVRTVAQLSSVHGNAVDNLYKVWKENPDRIKQISRLSPAKQAIEMARLDAEMVSKRDRAVTQQSSPPPPPALPKQEDANDEQQNSFYTSIKPPVKRPLSPTVPKGSSFKDPFNLSISEMIERDKQR